MRTTCLTAGMTLTALLFCGVANAADPGLLNLVMPDAGTLAGVNVTNAGITPFGQYVLNHITSSASADQELQKFISQTGFDPRHDVTEILAASAGSTTKPSGLILARGKFPVAQLTSAVGSEAPQTAIQTYGGATLISGGAKTSFSIAFIGDSIAVVGDTTSVKAAIDRSAGANSIDPGLATQVQALSTTQDAWMVSNTPVASLIPRLGTPQPGAAPTPFSQIGQIFSSIQSSSGGVKFGDTVLITGQAITNDATKAKSLADLIQGFASIISLMGAGQDPQAAALAGLLQGLKVTADGMTINIALSVPETQLETVLNNLNQARPMVKPAVKPALAPAPKAAPAKAMIAAVK